MIGTVLALHREAVLGAGERVDAGQTLVGAFEDTDHGAVQPIFRQRFPECRLVIDVLNAQLVDAIHEGLELAAEISQGRRHHEPMENLRFRQVISDGQAVSKKSRTMGDARCEGIQRELE